MTSVPVIINKSQVVSASLGSMLSHCQRDSYCKSLVATVLSCHRAGDVRRNANDKEKGKEKQSNGAGSKNAAVKDHKPSEFHDCESKQATTATAGAQPVVYDVVLTDTILFPEGGGQPSDMGFLSTVPPHGDLCVERAAVVYVYRDPEDRVHHRVQLPAPLAAGTQVLLDLDWPRRWDHMQQHSGQHLLSALALKHFEFSTTAWWLSRAPTECWVEFATDKLSPAQLEALEALTNEHIRLGLSMTAHNHASAQDVLRDARFRSRNDLSSHKGELRVVEIDGVDLNPCCGTHMNTTASLQVCKLISSEPARANTRVYFYFGDRAILNFSRLIKNEMALVATLAGGPESHVSMVQLLQNDNRTISRAHKNALSALAKYLGESIARTANAAGGDQKEVVYYHSDDGDFPLVELADSLSAHCPNHVALFTCRSAISKATGQFLLLGPANLGDRISTWGAEVAKHLQGKGGGRKGRFQGKMETLSQKQLRAALDYLNAQLS